MPYPSLRCGGFVFAHLHCYLTSDHAGSGVFRLAQVRCRYGRIHSRGNERKHKRAGRPSKREASCPARLCRRACTNIKPADYPYVPGISEGQVSFC